MGKIADAYVEIGADPKPFRETIKDLVYDARRLSFNIKESLKDAFSSENIKNLIENITGSSDLGWAVGELIKNGFGKAILAISAATAAAGAFAYALDAILSRSDEQKFADSVKGWTAGFRGLNEEIKKTDERIKSIMESDATGGNGGWLSYGSWKALFERITGVESMTSQVARNMNNAATASKLFADNMVKAAVAGRDAGFAKKGAEAAAGLIGPAGQREEQRINAAAFQRILDEQGGARVSEQVLAFFRANRGLVPGGSSPAEQANIATGALMAGDLSTTKLFADVFDIAGERVKVLAEEFDQATGIVEELAKIEKERKEKDRENIEAVGKLQEKIFGDIFKAAEEAKKKSEEFRTSQARAMNRETEQASREWLNLQERQGEAAARLADFEKERIQRINDSFMFADLKTARDRLFTAAVDNQRDDLTATKMRDEVSRIVDALSKLQAKWGMQ